MRLGEDTIGLRKLQDRVDELGDPVHDEYGDQIVDAVDVEVPWCLVYPTERTSVTAEPENRVAPAITGYTAVAPPEAGVELADVIIWPITGRATVDGHLQLSGRTWQVIGEPGLWSECTEVQLRAAT